MYFFICSYLCHNFCKFFLHTIFFFVFFSDKQKIINFPHFFFILSYIEYKLCFYDFFFCCCLFNFNFSLLFFFLLLFSQTLFKCCQHLNIILSWHCMPCILFSVCLNVCLSGLLPLLFWSCKMFSFKIFYFTSKDSCLLSPKTKPMIVLYILCSKGKKQGFRKRPRKKTTKRRITNNNRHLPKHKHKEKQQVRRMLSKFVNI